mmetsp:Transcript_15667/g.35095  ORF Transcript_15667/g.35095 Transcript_15667/m.35095 type:complete len:236 (-) Transcript_15667:68-775(-)
MTGHFEFEGLARETLLTEERDLARECREVPRRTLYSIYSPSPFSPATRLKSLMLVAAMGAPHSVSPESADTCHSRRSMPHTSRVQGDERVSCGLITSPSSWFEWMNTASCCTDWNLTKRRSIRLPSCSAVSSSSCAAGDVSASAKSKDLAFTKSLTPLGARPSGASNLMECTFVGPLNAMVSKSCSSASLSSSKSAWSRSPCFIIRPTPSLDTALRHSHEPHSISSMRSTIAAAP